MREPIDPFAQWDAAYVLGALSPDERRTFEEHLGSCASCAAAVAEFAGMPGLLARVQLDQLEEFEAEPVPPSILPALGRVVRRDRRRRRIWIGAAGLAAAACLALVVGLFVNRADAPPKVSTQRMTALVSVPIAAEIAIHTESWGTRVDVKCIYEQSATATTAYALWLIPQSGPDERLATWSGYSGEVAQPTGSTSLTKKQIRAIEIRSTSGTALLRLEPR